MRASSSLTTHQSLTGWLQRNDWALFSSASAAVDEQAALHEGVSTSAVKRSQLRAILNTACISANPNTFRRFLRERKERREKEASSSDKDHIHKKAAFWEEIVNQWHHAQHTYVNAAADELDLDLSEADQMRIIGAYFEHLIAHCQLRSKS
jgi:hypothetical protein